MTEEVIDTTNDSIFAGMSEESTVEDTGVDTTTTDTTTTETKEGGEGEAQELILGKFKSQEDLETSYKELQSKLGGFSGAPDEYDVTLGEDMEFTFYEGVDNDIGGFKDLAKELNLNQEGFSKIVDYYVKSEIDRNGIDIKAKQEAAIEMFGGKDKFAKEFNTYNAKVKATLGDEGMQLLQLATSTSPNSSGAVVKLVGQLLGKETAPMNSDTAMANAPTHTRTELNEMMRDKRYSTDSKFREDVQKGFQALYK